MPKLSPTMEEGQIARWIKNEGDTFEAMKPCRVDSKATIEMPRSRAARCSDPKSRRRDCSAGETIAIIGQKGEDITALLAEASNGSAKAPTKEEPKEETKAEKPEADEPGAEPAKALVPRAEPAKASAARATGTNGRMIVSPIAARMAADNGLDLRSISGSGPNGRIIKRDIEEALAGGSQPPPAKAFTPSTHVGASAFRDEPASKIRQVIATRLAESIGPIPTFYLTVEIEMDNVLATRKQMNASLDDEAKISVNDIIIKAAAMALIKHPWVNASYQDKTVRFYEQADIGVAVAIEEGLITPVIRGANLKGLAEISAQVRDLAGSARKVQPEEYPGATFSVSIWPEGSRITAIINPPEAAIIAVGGANPTAVVREGEVVVRSIMNVTMSCDHRVVDGATGAKFLQTFKQMLESPAMMLL